MVRLITDLNSLRNWVCSLSPNYALLAAILCSCLLVAALSLRRLLEKSERNSYRTRGRLSSTIGNSLLNRSLLHNPGAQAAQGTTIQRLGWKLAGQMEIRQRHAGMLRFLAELVLPFFLAGYALFFYSHETIGELAMLLVLVGVLSQSFRDILMAMEYWTAFNVGCEKLERVLSGRVSRDRYKLNLGRDEKLTLVAEELLVNKFYKPIDFSAGTGSTLFVSSKDLKFLKIFFTLICGEMNPPEGKLTVRKNSESNHHLLTRTDVARWVDPSVGWLEGTLQQNIMEGCDDKSKIARVFKNCGLDERWLTLDVKDLQLLGTQEREGLEARVRLARALVSQAQIFIVTDPWFYSDEAGRQTLERLCGNHSGLVIMAGGKNSWFCVDQVISPEQVDDGHSKSGGLFPQRISDSLTRGNEYAIT